MKLIIAGNYQQYLHYLQENSETPRTAKYISDSNMLRGLRDGEIIKYGTYYTNERIDWNLVKEYETRFKAEK